MTHTSHTPGPWHYNQPGRIIFGPTTRNVGAPILATLDKGTDTDARLIAEAPAMYEALVKAIRVLTQRDNCPDCFADNLGEHGALCVVRKARAIIARIEGEA